MITFVPFPIKVVVDGLGGCIVIYISENPIHENDCVTVAKLDGGQWYHVTTDRIKSWANETHGITKTKNPDK